MARRYGTFTPKRRAALKRASLISAAKRRNRFHAAVVGHRTTRNRALANAGFNQRKRSKAYKTYHQNLNQARVTHLGKKSRSQRKQNVIRGARAAGRYANYANTAALSVTLYAPNSKASHKINKAYYKGATKVVHGAKVAKASPHYAKGFAKGVKHGYVSRKVANNNMANFGGTKVARHHGPQMGSMKALPRGTGNRTSGGRSARAGRKVRGY